MNDDHDSIIIDHNFIMIDQEQPGTSSNGRAFILKAIREINQIEPMGKRALECGDPGMAFS